MASKRNLEKDLKKAHTAILKAQEAIEALMGDLPEYTNAPECNKTTMEKVSKKPVQKSKK